MSGVLEVVPLDFYEHSNESRQVSVAVMIDATVRATISVTAFRDDGRAWSEPTVSFPGGVPWTAERLNHWTGIANKLFAAYHAKWSPS